MSLLPRPRTGDGEWEAGLALVAEVIEIVRVGSDWTEFCQRGVASLAAFWAARRHSDRTSPGQLGCLFDRSRCSRVKPKLPSVRVALAPIPFA